MIHEGVPKLVVKDKQSVWRRVKKGLEIASEVGQLAMNLRDRPRALDWVGLLLRAADLMFKIKTEHSVGKSQNPSHFFGVYSGRWEAFPAAFHKAVLYAVSDATIVEGYWDQGKESPRAVQAKIGDEVVGWVQANSNPLDISEGPYYKSDRRQETLAAIGNVIWTQIGGRHCVISHGEVTLDTLTPTEYVSTKQLQSIKKRLTSFLNKGINRSVLFQGPPGTGKSLGVRHIIADLHLSSARADLLNFTGMSSNAAMFKLETALKILRPDVLVLDDLDRVQETERLLAFVETAVRTCKLVLATANCPEKFIGALLRPGRFDEIVYVNKLDPEVLEKLLGSADLAAKLGELPAAYVGDFVKRMKVFGVDQALAELPSLLKRAAWVEESTNKERGVKEDQPNTLMLGC